MDVLGAYFREKPPAVVFPIYDNFKPTTNSWDMLSRYVRSVGGDVYGLFRSFGPIHEQHVLDVWSILSHMDAPQADLDEEGSIHVRRFMNDAEQRYGRIVLVAHGPLQRVWSAGAINTKMTHKTKIVRMNMGIYVGFHDYKFHKAVYRAAGIELPTIKELR